LAEGWRRADVAELFWKSDEIDATVGWAAYVPLLRPDSDGAGEAEVFALYEVVLGRTPDVPGFRHWLELASTEPDLPALAALMMQSPEYRAFALSTERAFAAHVLTAAGDARPGARELDLAEALLAGGLSRADYVAALATSWEDVDVAAWIRDRGYDDVLIGGAGHNLLVDGPMSDVFLFDPEDGGRHRVLDLEPWDRVDLRGFGYEDAAEALGRFRQDGDRTVFEDQGVTVILWGTDLAEVTAAALLV
jgi:hypothetical protein